MYTIEFRRRHVLLALMDVIEDLNLYDEKMGYRDACTEYVSMIFISIGSGKET